MREPTAAPHARKPGVVSRLFPFYNRDQKLFILEAMLVNSANVITGGAFLSGLLLYMGATDFLVGLVSSSGTWSLMLSLVASAVVERVRNRKALLYWSVLVFRMLTTLPVLLPLALGRGLPSALTASVLIIAGNMVFSIYNTGFPVFFMGSLPAEGQANYIYVRMFWIRLAYACTFLIMGLLLDLLHKSYLGFILVFFSALVIGVADCLVIRRIGGQPDAPRAQGSNLLGMLLRPLGNRRYVLYLAFTAVFFFSLACSSSYTGLYQLKYLNLSYLSITALNIATFAVMILTTHMWARLQQRWGMVRVLIVGAVLAALEFIVYGLLTPDTLGLIVLSPILSGIGNGGYWGCTLPYRYSLMPEEGRPAYEGWFGMVFGGANLLGTVVGGQMQLVMPTFALPWLHFSVFQVNYLLSAAVALLSVAAFWALSRHKPENGNL